jgi:hypothetical protein
MHRTTLLLIASLALLPLAITACDTSSEQPDDESELNALIGTWEVTFKEGVALPDVQNFDDDYGLARRETRGEMQLFADLTGYIDIIEEDFFSGESEPNVDYQIWDLRILERDNPKKVHARIIQRDQLRVLDCTIGNNKDRLTCHDPEIDAESTPEVADPSIWEFVKTK